jgi:hypothetical protein
MSQVSNNSKNVNKGSSLKESSFPIDLSNNKDKNAISPGTIDLESLIDRATLYYDMHSIKYKDIINTDKIELNRETNIIVFPNIDKKEWNYEILGIFDNTTNIWIWAWMVPDFLSNETNIVKKLLSYGLKINTTYNEVNMRIDKLYLRTQLVNSRFLLQDEFQLELHLAISSYLAKDNFKFIYQKKKYLSSDKKKYITIYYIIK